MTLDRASWERRWAAEPGLRPTCILTNKEGRWFTVCTPCAGVVKETGVVWLHDDFAAALILAKAVEALVVPGRIISIDYDGETAQYVVGLTPLGGSFHGPTLLDALGAAVDAVIAGREGTV